MVPVLFGHGLAFMQIWAKAQPGAGPMASLRQIMPYHPLAWHSLRKRRSHFLKADPDSGPEQRAGLVAFI